MMESGVYKITNLVNGKLYVGSAVGIERRWMVHRCELKKNVHGNEYLQRAWLKYGPDAFVFKILEQVKPERLIEREQFWMDKLEVVKSGYNICPIAGKPGDRTGAKHTVAAKAKMSAAKKGKTSPMKGKKFSSEARDNIRIASKGRAPSCAAIKKAADFNRGKPLSPEHRKKISDAKRGRKGRKLSPEHIAKLVAINKARWEHWRLEKAVRR